MTNLPMDGKGVYLTRVQRFAYGHKVGYKVYTEYDGFDSVSFEDFWELEAMLTTAGHAKPDRQHRHITDLNHKAELMVIDNNYRVACVYASDGTKVTREQVIETRNNKRRDMNARMKSAIGIPISERFKMAAREKAEKKRQELFERYGFSEGEKLHAYRKASSWYLIEVSGEYVLRQRLTQAA